MQKVQVKAQPTNREPLPLPAGPRARRCVRVRGKRGCASDCP
jgi:hypothetical protein